ncbi:uncharacterized protein LOC117536645 [Gymnodraco acuticeps]|uniref:Uncharacterized protein LOC117536645 n=1 Tax=Gymnodraco acuticeps TaxID=8218 RepID=A0A6P8T1W2_GYMAC|nr:uncharacterized protein LOC117536645 [Gymnodraco acuticeps]
MTRFLQGVRRQHPVVHVSTPQWDLPLVLKALVTEPFEPLELSSLKALSLKTALLLAFTLAKRVCELTALSVHLSCLFIRGDRSGATLRPNPSFVPKNLRSLFRSRAIQLDGFSLPPHTGDRKATLHLLCPVRALACYVGRKASIGRTELLFVCFGDGVAGKALSKKRLTGWLCECISHAGRESLSHWGPCILYTWYGCVDSLVQRRKCGGHIHGGVLVYVRPVNKVLSFGHVGLIFIVCACWGNTGLVKGGGLWVSKLYLTPLDIMHLRLFSCSLGTWETWCAVSPIQGWKQAGRAFPTKTHK